MSVEAVKAGTFFPMLKIVLCSPICFWNMLLLTLWLWHTQNRTHIGVASWIFCRSANDEKWRKFLLHSICEMILPRKCFRKTRQHQTHIFSNFHRKFVSVNIWFCVIEKTQIFVQSSSQKILCKCPSRWNCYQKLNIKAQNKLFLFGTWW